MIDFEAMARELAKQIAQTIDPLVGDDVPGRRRVLIGSFIAAALKAAYERGFREGSIRNARGNYPQDFDV